MKEKVLIFGGTSGIGLATATSLSAAGFEVHATGRDADKVARLKGEFPQVHFYVADSASDDSLGRGLKDLESLDHAVFALSSSKGVGPFATLKIEEVGDGFAGKVLCHLRSLKTVLPRMSKRGSATFVSGAAAQMADPGTVGLAAINGAIEAMIRPLAVELAPLRVNAVCPGLVNTPWWNFLPEEQKRAVFTQYADRSLVGRVGEPHDISAAVRFLIENQFTTGVTLTCDGGLRLRARA